MKSENDIKNKITGLDKFVTDPGSMGWESPIKAYMGELQVTIENGIYQAVQQCGFDVDKEELLKALQYDRQQYEKGYAAGHIDGMLQAEKLYARPQVAYLCKYHKEPHYCKHTTRIEDALNFTEVAEGRYMENDPQPENKWGNENE